MGLVKTGRRRGRSPRPTGRECCQCGSVASSNVANFPIWGGGYGAGRIGLIYYLAKGKLRWRQNADIAVRRAAGMDARTAVTFCLVACKQDVTKGKEIL